MLASVSPAAPTDDAKKAIERGVAALKLLPPEGTNVKKHPPGSIALWALTLLECDIPAADPLIQKAARELRQHSIELTHNYSLALAILFFDRLGEPADIYLIQSLAVRLFAGQTYADGWSYNSPRPGAEEVRRLTSWLKQRNAVTAKEAPKPPVDKKKLPTLPAELQEQLKLMKQAGGDTDNRGVGDNSNTQFAVMALWVARRYGIPVEDAMARVNTRFRKTQGGDSGWAYVPSTVGQGEGSTASMTCAGLLALAMSHGVAVETTQRADPKSPAARLPIEPAKDLAIRNALLALGSVIGTAKDQSSPKGGVVLNKGYYFLWSLERVGVAYNLNTIGNKDWYAWGSDILLSSQRPDGTWRGEEGPEIDTCFALLFLRRANLARDLSAALKGMTDPGQVTLKVGGVGGQELIDKRLKSGIDVTSKTGDQSAISLPKDLDPETAKLCLELLKADAQRQPQVLERLKESKGVVYTDALAAAIPRLSGTVQDKARDALAERFLRMSAATLRGKFTEEDVEVRVAAIRACATKDDKSHIPDLIGLLNDREARVTQATHKALTLLARQDFGPAANATAVERDKAIVAWKAWWQKQANK
jgi:hypothetical protein